MADVPVVSQDELQQVAVSVAATDAAVGNHSPVSVTDHLLGRLGIGCVWFGLGVLAFGVIQRLPSVFASSACALDRFVPFIPEAVFVYLSFFVVLPLAASAMSGRHFRATLHASLFAAVVAFVIYLLWPTAHGQQAPETVRQGWLTLVYRGVYKIDRASNCFPSLHVGLSTIVAFGLAHCRPRFAKLGWLFAICIIASTVLTKQHHALDLLGGIVLAAVAWRFYKPRD